jgi:cob(I)alamin adenosyltransferase
MARVLDRVLEATYPPLMHPSEDRTGSGNENESDDGKPFAEPSLAINRVYTRHGDAGKTRLVGGQQVSKDDARLEAYGTVDELNAFVGVARQTLAEARSTMGAPPAPETPPVPPQNPRAASAVGRHQDELAALDGTLRRVQHELFNLGSILATLPEDVHPRQPRVTAAEVAALEAEMDRCQAALAPLRSFVLPGGCRLNADLHVARTVCRRAERLAFALSRSSPVDPEALKYLNRLSDAFFVWSRWASHLLAVPEVLWAPNEAASGAG